MADVEDTTVVATEDTGLSNEAQASENDDVNLEDMDITFNDLEESEEDEAATESTKEETSEEAVVETEAVAEVTEEAKGEDTDPEAERKRFNAEMAKQRIAEKQAREAALEAQQALEAERLQNYLAEAEGDDEEYIQRQRNIEAYKLQNERAELNAERLQIGIDKALANIDLFRTGSDVAKRQLMESLDEFEATQVVKNQFGKPIEVKSDVYQYLVKKADSIRELTQAGAVQEAKTKEQTNARTITPPSRAPREPKVDKDLADFDSAIGW
jgi:hypothetical protein